MAELPSIPTSQTKLLKRLSRGDSFKGVEIGDIDFTDHCFKKHVDFEGAIFRGKTIFVRTQLRAAPRRRTGARRRRQASDRCRRGHPGGGHPTRVERARLGNLFRRCVSRSG